MNPCRGRCILGRASRDSWYLISNHELETIELAAAHLRRNADEFADRQARATSIHLAPLLADLASRIAKRQSDRGPYPAAKGEPFRSGGAVERVPMAQPLFAPSDAYHKPAAVTDRHRLDFLGAYLVAMNRDHGSGLASVSTIWNGLPYCGQAQTVRDAIDAAMDCVAHQERDYAAFVASQGGSACGINGQPQVAGSV